jgi:hypothetical protein
LEVETALLLKRHSASKVRLLAVTATLSTLLAALPHHLRHHLHHHSHHSHHRSAMTVPAVGSMMVPMNAVHSLISDIEIKIESTVHSFERPFKVSY